MAFSVLRNCGRIPILTNVVRKSGFLKQRLMCTIENNNVVTQDMLATAGTMTEVKNKLAKSLGIQLTYTPIPQNREYLLKYAPKVEDLPARTMQDSFTSAVIPLSKDKVLQDKYVTFLGSVRLGRLMEDMDLFAVWVVHQHLKLPNLEPSIPLPYIFVTVLVDKISFTDIIPKYDSDIRLSGHVSWVGRSSIEVVVWLEQFLHGRWRKITRALFLMAARNATNTGAALINPLVPGDDDEKNIFVGGESRKQRRLKVEKESIFHSEPSEFEQNLIHKIFMQTIDMNNKSFNVRSIPSGAVWMEDAFLSNIIYSHPEDRNAHNTVFGGFLMRHALEISWALGHQFSKFRPKLEHISDISFHRPVYVSSLIKMDAHVIYTEMNYIQIAVVTQTFETPSSVPSTSNTFYYTYSVQEKVPEIIPRTYHEAMWYLDGRRKFNSAMGFDGHSIESQFGCLGHRLQPKNTV